MTILVTGGNGQVATALAELGGARVRRVGRPEFDFDAPDSIAACFAAAAPSLVVPSLVVPSLVVNAAAWTAVDAAETAPDAAWRANAEGPAILARLCAEAGIPLIHISTDYVFDGLKGAPYVETDPTSPTGVYGASKLAGEQAVLAACPRAVILRTSWVYAATGKNFLRTMLGAAQRTSHLRVVSDQIGCPTNAEDLAQAILAVAARLLADPAAPSGIFHAAGTGWTSWHGFATAIFAAAGMPAIEVEAIRTADWPTPARRPPESRLDCAKLARAYGVALPDWKPSMARTLRHLLGGVAP